MDAILHPLVNRGTGFIWPRFPTDDFFVPAGLSEHAQSVAAFLRLADTTTDYYVLGPLQALAGAPWILEDIADPDQLKALVYYPQPETGWAGATLVAGLEGVSRFCRRPVSWPVELGITITYLTATAATIVSGSSRWTVDAILGPSGRLKLAWPAELGAAGLLDVGGTWTDGSVVEITHTPRAYPYQEVVTALGNLRATNQLLLRAGLASAWTAVRSPLEQLALISRSLISAYRNAKT